MERINGTNFDLDFCRKFSPEKLRLIYKNESAATLTLLIAKCFPKEVEEVKEVKEPKTKKVKQ